MPYVIGAAYVSALSLHFLNNRVVERNDYVRPFLGADFLCVIPGSKDEKVAIFLRKMSGFRMFLGFRERETRRNP